MAAIYLARLLTGDTAAELKGRRIQRVSFQQAPAHRVDDLVISSVDDVGGSRMEVEIAIRRKPDFTTSDKKTEKLIGSLLAAVRSPTRKEVSRQLVICVAGPQTAAEQVSELAGLAAKQSTASGFFSLVQTPRKFTKALRKRLEHLVALVTANLKATEEDPSAQAAEAATWQLLGNLQILMPRLEPPDETDWVQLLGPLESWAREQTVRGATSLRDRLEALAAEYDPAAANIDLSILRRDLHEQIHLERRRREAAWTELRRLDVDARDSVRHTLGVGPSPEPLHLNRQGPASELRRKLSAGGTVLVSGDSGVGKSALVLDELARVVSSEPDEYEVVCLNLRLLTATMTELRNALGAPLEDLLSEMSAPTRILVLDAADVILERGEELLDQILRAARAADVTPWVVTATEGRNAIRAALEVNTGPIQELTIGGLEDEELKEIASVFPQLRLLVEEPRAKQLLRRPVVTDLFVRSGSHGLPLSDSDAFEIVWTKLIRSDERETRGLPDARDLVMLRLAVQQLRGTDPTTVYQSLDPAAVAGLRHDAVLRPVDRWQSPPTFSHELLRTYAIAQVLLAAEDPIGELIATGAPRWALLATRLAVQVLLSSQRDSDPPTSGRFARLQASIDRLPEAGHGDRWSDLPAEAVLTLPKAQELLADAWPTLVEGNADGLRRLLRVIRQRHGRTEILDRLVAEPVVELLLENSWPSHLKAQVDELLQGWLRGLVQDGEPRGHRLRIALRERLVARVEAGDERLSEAQREWEKKLAARTPEEVAQDEARDRELQRLRPPLFGRRRNRKRRELPSALAGETLLVQLSLLGTDLGDDGEQLLARVAADDPDRLKPALEGLLTGQSLASYDTKLLAQLVDAYYIDEVEDYDGLASDGIRHHSYLPWAPLAAPYRGPFLALFRSDPQSGVACLNGMLNHAARARVEVLRRLDRGDSDEETDDRYVFELEITGKRRQYVGDHHVWMWYRGTGVGPHPCMSALQALELVCDEYLKAGVAIDAVARLLLLDCENLAMPALVLGMLVRHFEDAGPAIDPFLSEPTIWRLEFARKTQESSMLAARTEGIAAPERRSWDLRDVAFRLALTAPPERRESLKEVGRRLIDRAAELWGSEADQEPLSEEMAAVRVWAGSLDAERCKLTHTDDSLLIEHVPEEEAATRLATSNTDLARGQDAFRLFFRYPERYCHINKPDSVTREELLTDIATARGLAGEPPETGPGRPFDAPAAVAAAALESHFLGGTDVPENDLVWSAGLLVGLLNAFVDHEVSESDDTVFGNGADRSAARVVPLLLLPGEAQRLRDLLVDEGVDATAIARGIEWIVGKGANETRLFLARGFDPLWSTPCAKGAGTCHHVDALSTIEDIARDSLIGSWDPELQRKSRPRVEGPVARRLQQVDQERFNVPRLSAAIRGSVAAAVSSPCCRTEALELLDALLSAHRRGMRGSEPGYFHSDDDAAVAARAVLEVAASGDDSLLFTHLEEYADHPRLLSEFLKALTASGEENQRRAAAAAQVWPAVLKRVVEFVSSGRCPRDDHHYGRAPLAAVIPAPSYEAGYLHREYEGERILWADPVALASEIEDWLPLAAGHSEPLDSLIDLLDRLPAEQQAQRGLPWMEQLVMASPKSIAKRSYLLPNWLERVRRTAKGSLRGTWHRIVDALTVAGDNRVARLDD